MSQDQRQTAFHCSDGRENRVSWSVARQLMAEWGLEAYLFDLEAGLLGGGRIDLHWCVFGHRNFLKWWQSTTTVIVMEKSRVMVGEGPRVPTAKVHRLWRGLALSLSFSRRLCAEAGGKGGGSGARRNRPALPM